MNKRSEVRSPRAEAGAASFFPSLLEKLHATSAGLLLLAGAVLLCLGAIFLLSPNSPLASGSAYGGFEAGKVADRDVVATEDVTFVDQMATAAARAKAARSVVPVFQRDESSAKAALSRFEALRSSLASLPTKDAASVSRAIREGFPGLMPADTLRLLPEGQALSRALAAAGRELALLHARGVFSFPDAGMEAFNQDRVELRSWSEKGLSVQELSAREVLTPATWASRLAESDRALRSDPILPAVEALARPFAVPTVFFDPEASAQRMDAAMGKVEPIFSHVSRGDRVVKKGYIVDQAQLQRLAAMGGRQAPLDLKRLLGSLGFLTLLFGFGAVLLGPRLTGRPQASGDGPLLLGLGIGYFVIALAASRISGLGEAVPWAVFLPTGVVAILVTVLLGPRSGVTFSFLMAVSILGLSGLDAQNAIFALFSGVAAALSARRANQRLDLVKAGLVLAIFQSLMVLIVSALAGKAGGDFRAFFIAGLNGFLCGSLALGLLPLLESALNVPTRFRLMELSDLHSPALSRLLSVAPGTYSHSIMVAHLSETACRDIGANHLLARVASYYHDIGKADQPEYFTENQTAGNKHDALKPRLSAAVIRAHVKVGAEKARALRLPEEVIDIINEHHGNSLIRYFYGEALKEEPTANPEDFSYPGRPPASRESAVVMLADSIEAASRSLTDTSPEGIASFVERMVMEKFTSGMLSQSELSIRDLEVLKASFIRILSGHFHSRIAYPNLPGSGPREAAAEEAAPASRQEKEATSPEKRASMPARPRSRKKGGAT